MGLYQSLRRAGILGAALSAMLATTIQQARANDTLDWLAREPVTLMDLGIIHLKSDMRETGERLYQTGILPTPPVTGAYYSWREKRITVYLTTRDRYGDPQQGMCLELFGRAVKAFAGRSEGQKNNVSWYLEQIFTHEGFGNFTRPKTMREQLLKSVRLEVTLLPAETMSGRRVQCWGQLDADLDDIVLSTS